ncbi:MAG: RDD family protein [Pseudomonadota bacterium]
MENQNYAGFWIRFVAVLIDVIIIMCVLGIPLTLIYGQEYWMGDQLVHGFWDVILNYVAPAILTIWFWIRFLGTPGKMLLQLQVVDAKSGGRLSIGQAIIRYFSYILSALPLLLGYIWVGFDKRKQSFHDKLAGTVVVRKGDTKETHFDIDV